MATQNLPDFGAQRVTDFFKAASRNMLITIWTVRLIAIGMLFLLINAILTTLKASVGNFENVQILFAFLILIALTIVLALLSLLSYVVGTLLSSNQASVDFVLAVRSFILNQIFGSVTLLDFIDEELFLGGTDPFAPLAYLLNKPQKEIYNPIITKGLLLTGILLIVLTGIGFIRRSDVKLAGITLVLAQLVIGIGYLKSLTLPLTMDNTSVSTMMGSSLFQLALISYLYFEFSLQTGYLYNLTSPTLTRQRRVGKSLQRLSQFRLGITKLGTEDEKDSAEARKARESEDDKEAGVEKTSSSMSTGTGSTTSKKFGADALIFLLDSAQDSLFAKPGGEQERLTGRLQRYHDGLLQHDPKLDDKLGGSAEKAFNPFWVLATVFVSLIIRLGVLIFLSWLVIKPETLLEFIALPQSITNSLEIDEPEGLLVVLIPVVFLILGISYLFARLQEWIVKAEELIIDEADIGRLIHAGKAITDREQGEKQIEEMDSKSSATSADGTQKPRRRRKRKAKSKSKSQKK